MDYKDIYVGQRVASNSAKSAGHNFIMEVVSVDDERCFTGRVLEETRGNSCYHCGGVEGGWSISCFSCCPDPWDEFHESIDKLERIWILK